MATSRCQFGFRVRRTAVLYVAFREPYHLLRIQQEGEYRYAELKCHATKRTLSALIPSYCCCYFLVVELATARPASERESLQVTKRPRGEKLS